MSQTRNAKNNETNRKCKEEGQIFKTRTRRKQRDMRVLAERNPAVVPVGAWVESGEEDQEHPAIRALLTEELLEETRKAKEESLRQFQEAVRRRVSEQARIRKQQRQKTYKAETECRVFQQKVDPAQHHTLQKGQFTPWPQGELTSQGARWITAQELTGVGSDHANQHRHQFSRIMTQARRRLAACQTAQKSEDDSELPGGPWKASLANDKIVGGVKEDIGEEEDEDAEDLGEKEEVLLAGQHDEPVCSQRRKAVTFQNDMVRERVSREPHASGADCRSARVLWLREDPEEQTKQLRRSQLLTYRRLVMDVEREQAKEHQRRKKQLRRTARIKAEKEQQREEEERRMERARQQEESRRELAEKELLILERLRLEEEQQRQEEEKRRRTQAKKSKEATRYVEALRAHIKEKLEEKKAALPPLCCCAETFWDSHPDTCANNCAFYNDPKAYAQALHSVLRNCELYDGGAGPGGFTRKTRHRTNSN